MTTTLAMPDRFTKKPVTVEAVQFKNDGSSYALIRWINEGQHAAGRRFASWRNNEIIVPTLEGEHIASVGDWIIKGVKGEFYPCKPDIFEMTYDRATLQAQPAEVSDERLLEIGREWTKEVGWYEFEVNDFIGCARAILALRPQAVPMTDEQFTQLLRKLKRSREVFQAGRDSYETACAPMNSDDEAWFAYLAHHGITAPAGGEKQA